MSILSTLHAPDLTLTISADEAKDLPSDSVKLGSSNLSAAKLLHKDLQAEYTENQVSYNAQ